MCATRTLILQPPFESLAPQGADSLLSLGARLARGRAPGKEGRGAAPRPRYSARDSQPPHPEAVGDYEQSSVVRAFQACSHQKSPVGHLIVSAGRAVCTSLLRWGRHEFRRFAFHSQLRGNVLSVRSCHTDTNAVPGTPVHTEAEDGLRVHSRAQYSVPHDISTAARGPSILTAISTMSRNRQRKRPSLRKLSRDDHKRNAKRWLSQQRLPKDLLSAYAKRYGVPRNDVHIELLELG